jgi:2-desacetyl-2-hydroxyethyl bacteriochlorophyllide A dehydrogenase
MPAALFRPQGQVDLVEVPVPPRAPGGILLKVQACGICGSDLHTLRGTDAPPPVCLGHEIAGEVLEVDPGADLRPGDHVAVEPLVYCGRCRYCASGHYAHCPDLRIVGFDLPGGYAAYLHLPSTRGVYRVPPEMPWEQVALVEPLAVGVHALRLAGLAYGMSVAVVGGGTIGQLAVQAARAMGARRTGLLAKYPHQVDLAARLGATAVGLSTDAGALARLAAELGGEVDVVVEAVGGQSEAVQQALTLVHPLGTVLLAGGFTGPVALDAEAVLWKEVRLLGSLCYGAAIDQRRDFALAIDLLCAGAVEGAALITHRYPLSRAPEAFATALDKGSGVIKAMLLC